MKGVDEAMRESCTASKITLGADEDVRRKMGRNKCRDVTDLVRLRKRTLQHSRKPFWCRIREVEDIVNDCWADRRGICKGILLRRGRHTRDFAIHQATPLSLCHFHVLMRMNKSPSLRCDPRGHPN